MDISSLRILVSQLVFILFMTIHTTNSYSLEPPPERRTETRFLLTRSTLQSATVARSTPGENHEDRWLTRPSAPPTTLLLKFLLATVTPMTVIGGAWELLCLSALSDGRRSARKIPMTHTAKLSIGERRCTFLMIFRLPEMQKCVSERK